ncbi:hypothetical protein H0H92_006568 [Tricholoma furcatifolium]|nr:hypothetical protein H0H92_006568 [Tricholoma furcatifolium]
MSSIIASPAVGNTSVTSQIFDDLQQVGFAPVRQDIIKIQKIQVFWHPTLFVVVTGIKVTYLVRNGNGTKTVDVQHGSGASGDADTRVLQSNEYLVGIFGNVDGRQDTAGALRTLNFLIFDNGSGEVNQFSPQPPPTKLPPGGPGPVVPVTGFSSYGLTVAFGGSVSNDTQRAISIYPGISFQSDPNSFTAILEAISVYKYLPGAGGVNIV